MLTASDGCEKRERSPVQPLVSRWNVHEHKQELSVSDHATIYHPEHGQLCTCERHWDVLLYHPIVFRNRGTAYLWIQTGCIADLQESLSDLSVGFSLVTFQNRDRCGVAADGEGAALRSVLAHMRERQEAALVKMTETYGEDKAYEQGYSRGMQRAADLLNECLETL